MKPDSTRATKSELRVYEAGLHNASVRMECDDGISAVVHIFDGKQTMTWRVFATTLVCLRHCLNQWARDTKVDGEKSGEDNG